jgi:hypothetical protein
MIDKYERLRDIPAHAKQRAEEDYVSLSAYRTDPDDQRFPRPVELFMRAFAWGVLSLGAVVLCYQVLLFFTGGQHG